MQTTRAPLYSRNAALGLAVLLLACILFYGLVISARIASEGETGPVRAARLAASVESALGRLDHLPLAIARDPAVIAALKTGATRSLNTYLSDLAARSGAEVIYVMTPDGLTIAASNHAAPGSFIGQSYRFRPYFQQAIGGGTGRFFAVGVTTGRPGYFVADPVLDAGQIVGVVVVKLSLDDLTAGWRDTQGAVLLTTVDGIVLSSTDPALLYGGIAPITPELSAKIADDRQFAGAAIAPLNWQADRAGRVTLNGQAYLHSTAPIPRENWTLHLLRDLNTQRLEALRYVALLVVGLLVLGGIAVLWRSAQLRSALALSDADRRRLSQEIEDRRRAEAQLQQAQAELARASRLAALGQLSASITHELGQPISAMKNYLTAAEIGQNAAPGSLNPALTGLVARMQSITDQLRFFATPSRRNTEDVALQDIVTAATSLTAHSMEQACVTLTTDMPSNAVTVRGVPHRLEQVAVNLLRNAMQAACGQTPAEVHVSVTQTADHACLAVTDTGAGLGNLTIGDMTEPFMTTKSSGEGMGLGLAISAQIVKDHGGTLTATNATAGGAVFTVTLPLTPEPS